MLGAGTGQTPALTGALWQALLASPGRASERALETLATVMAEHPAPRARAPTRKVLRRYLAPACAAALELWEAGTLRGLSWGTPDPQHALALPDGGRQHTPSHINSVLPPQAR